MCDAFLDYMQYPGCDKTSAFVRKGKEKPYIILMKQTVLEAFAGLEAS